MQSDRDLSFKFLNINDSNAFETAPKGRPNQYAFRMSGNAVNTVMSSPVLLNTLATGIINNYNSASSVNFDMWQSGLTQVYGLIQNGELKPFKCPKNYLYGGGYKNLVLGEHCPV